VTLRVLIISILYQNSSDGKTQQAVIKVKDAR